MNPKSTCILINVITGMVEKPTLEKIMSGINIRFKFFVNTFNKKLMRGDVKIINEDTIHPFKL